MSPTRDRGRVLDQNLFENISPLPLHLNICNLPHGPVKRFVPFTRHRAEAGRNTSIIPLPCLMFIYYGHEALEPVVLFIRVDPCR